MIAHAPISTRQIGLGFAAGVALTALAAAVIPALAQTPTPAPDMSQMLEWCRQMMSSMDMQAMFEACRQMMGQAGGQMQGMMSGMMSGMCMMGR